MSRRVHEEGLRERQNMRNATHKRGNWCIVGFKDEWEDGFGLQGTKYESKENAQERANEIETEEEFKGVKHKVMHHNEYNQKYAEKYNRRKLRISNN